MVQCVKSLVTRPDNLGLIPGIYLVEERTNSYVLSSDFHSHAVVCMQATTTQTYKYFCLFSLDVGGRWKENYKETRLPVSYHNKTKKIK